MEKKNELKKKANENKKTMMAIAIPAACIAGYIGILVWEHKTFKTVTVKDWKKLTGQSTFDELLDKKIVGSFATVEYEDGTVGIVKDILAVADKLIEQSPKEG
jgi:hypothetical protein